MVSDHPHISGLCLSNQCCVRCRRLHHLHRLHSRLTVKRDNVIFFLFSKCSSLILYSLFRRHIRELLQRRQPGNVRPLLFWPEHNNHISLGMFCYKRGKWCFLIQQPESVCKLRKGVFGNFELLEPCSKMRELEFCRFHDEGRCFDIGKSSNMCSRGLTHFHILVCVSRWWLMSSSQGVFQKRNMWA